MQTLTYDHKKSVFVSYSRQDLSKVQPLVRLLRASDVNVFMDIDDINYGDKWEEVLEEQIKASERMLVFWSEHASKSDYVRREYSKALQHRYIRIVPVPLDDTPFTSELGRFQAMTDLRPLVRAATDVRNPFHVLLRRPLDVMVRVGVFACAFGLLFVIVSHPGDNSGAAARAAALQQSYKYYILTQLLFVTVILIFLRSLYRIWQREQERVARAIFSALWGDAKFVRASVINIIRRHRQN